MICLFGILDLHTLVANHMKPCYSVLVYSLHAEFFFAFSGVRSSVWYAVAWFSWWTNFAVLVARENAAPMRNKPRSRKLPRWPGLHSKCLPIAALSGRKWKVPYIVLNITRLKVYFWGSHTVTNVFLFLSAHKYGFTGDL